MVRSGSREVEIRWKKIFKGVNNAWGDSILYEGVGSITNLKDGVEDFVVCVSRRILWVCGCLDLRKG